MKIFTRDIPPRAAWQLEQAGVHPLLARLYAARGVLAADDLREAALRDDAAAWTAAWSELDAREGERLLAALARREPVRLTLCGERAALSLCSARPSFTQKLQRALGLRARASASELLKTL